MVTFKRQIFVHKGENLAQGGGSTDIYIHKANKANFLYSANVGFFFR